MAPFTIDVEGHAEIPHPAERALIHVCVASTGLNKAAVSDEVLTTTSHVENLLRDLSPIDDTPEAKVAAPLAHWSKTSLSSTSWLPYDYTKKAHMARQYNARIKFDIRFKEFKALGDFGNKLSSLEHTEVTHIDWILTAATEKSFRSQLRKAAARDALQKAHDYCEVLDCTSIRAVKVEETKACHRVGAAVVNPQMTQGGVSYQQMQVAPGHNPQGDADCRNENPLEFRPQEVRMSMSVSVRFHAE
jgi:hypothetical protein